MRWSGKAKHVSVKENITGRFTQESQSKHEQKQEAFVQEVQRTRADNGDSDTASHSKRTELNRLVKT